VCSHSLLRKLPVRGITRKIHSANSHARLHPPPNAVPEEARNPTEDREKVEDRNGEKEKAKNGRTVTEAGTSASNSPLPLALSIQVMAHTVHTVNEVK
jgi:hypothetical protein